MPNSIDKMHSKTVLHSRTKTLPNKFELQEFNYNVQILKTSAENLIRKIEMTVTQREPHTSKNFSK